MVIQLIVLFLLSTNAANAFTSEIKLLEAEIEALGTSVIWSKGYHKCTRNLYGFYIPKKDMIIICQRNHRRNYAELINTLKHEGWHAVQHKCNGNQAVLNDNKLRAGLQIEDQEVLHDYHPKDRRLEAEARVLAEVPTRSWIKGLRAYCKK